MSKKSYTKRGRVLKESDYKTIKHLFSYELSNKQISDITGWKKNTILSVARSEDYADYRRMNAERLKKPDIVQKKAETTALFPELPSIAPLMPMDYPVLPTIEQSLERIVLLLGDLVEVVKTKRRIL